MSRPAASLPPFEEVYRAHFDFVWSNLRRLGVRAADLEDATHDVFSVVHRRRHTYDGSARVQTWLFGILRRVASHHRRREQRRGRRVEALEREPRFVDPPDAPLAQRDALRHVGAFLDELDAHKREVFILAHFANLSGREIAESLSINPNTASARLRAARLELRRFIERRDLEDAFEEVWTRPEPDEASDDVRRRVLAGLLPGIASPPALRPAQASGWTVPAICAAATLAAAAALLMMGPEPKQATVRDVAVAAVDPPPPPRTEPAPVSPRSDPGPPEAVPTKADTLLPTPPQAHPSRPRTPPRAKKKPPPKAPASASASLDDLDEQNRLARQVSATNDPREALRLIDVYERRFPRGFFGERLSAERLGALCKLGRRDQAKQLVAVLRGRYPSSTLLPRDPQAPCGPNPAPITKTTGAGDSKG